MITVLLDLTDSSTYHCSRCRDGKYGAYTGGMSCGPAKVAERNCGHTTRSACPKPSDANTNTNHLARLKVGVNDRHDAVDDITLHECDLGSDVITSRGRFAIGGTVGIITLALSHTGVGTTVSDDLVGRLFLALLGILRITVRITVAVKGVVLGRRVTSRDRLSVD